MPIGVPAGRYFGVPVYFSGSWFIFTAFITFSWAAVVRDNVSTISNGQSYAVALGFAVLLGISVLAHELGHCVVSIALGMKVRRVVIFLLGGVSEIENEPERPAHEYLVAVAGPLVSLLLAAAGAAAYPALDADTVGRWLVVQLMLSNLLVMAFNLLPGLPLDGGRVLRAARLAGHPVPDDRHQGGGVGRPDHRDRDHAARSSPASSRRGSSSGSPASCSRCCSRRSSGSTPASRCRWRPCGRRCRTCGSPTSYGRWSRCRPTSPIGEARPAGPGRPGRRRADRGPQRAARSR